MQASEAPQEQMQPELPMEAQEQPQAPQNDVEAVMQQYGVDENMAGFILEATQQGYSDEEIASAIERNSNAV